MNQDLPSPVWKRCALSVLAALVCITSFGQQEGGNHFEAGFTMGPTNFLGDLGGNTGRGTTFLKDNNLQMTKLTFGGYISYHPSAAVAFRFAYNHGWLEGDDRIIHNKGGLEGARKTRNSNFRSRFSEGLLLAEIYPTTLLSDNSSDLFHRILPFVAAGVGVFHFNSEGQDPLTGNWVALKPLSTEGQGFAEYPARKPYKLTQPNVPLGLGVKYYISDNLHVSVEIIHRVTFTDYIDDVSTTYIDPALFYQYMPQQQAALAERMANKSGGVYTAGNKRGTATNNDAYYSMGFKIGFRLGKYDPYRMSCPVNF